MLERVFKSRAEEKREGKGRRDRGPNLPLLGMVSDGEHPLPARSTSAILVLGSGVGAGIAGTMKITIGSLHLSGSSGVVSRVGSG